MKGRVFGCVFGLVFVVPGLLLTALTYISMAEGRSTLKWPSTSGTVLSAEVDTAESRSSSDSGITQVTTVYMPKITYSYAVEGSTYTGNRVSVWERDTSDSRHANETLARYPAGSKVDVYYKPEDPSSAVLEPGGSRFGYVGLVGGGFFCFAGVLLIIKSLTGGSV